MPRQSDPELKEFLGRRVSIKLNGNRKVEGLLRGFDSFMNIVLGEAEEIVSTSESLPIGRVVWQVHKASLECLIF